MKLQNKLKIKNFFSRLQTSKVIMFFTFLLFAGCLFFCLGAVKEDTLDTAVFVAAITVTGGIYGTSTLWYFKKAQAENTIKIKTTVYKVAVDEKIRYNREIYKLKKKYGGEPDESDNIEVESLEDEALSDMTTAAATIMDDATSVLEKVEF